MILSFIKQLFSKPTIPETPIQSNNSICFSIEDDGKVKINYQLCQTNDKDADKFANLLFLINEGYYVKDILDSMVSIVEQNNNHQTFIHNIISYWSIYANIIDVETTEKPIVSPSQFYRKNDK